MHKTHTIGRPQCHSENQPKSLTSEQSGKYQQPESHSLPHTASLRINNERVEEGETGRKRWGRREKGRVRRRDCDTGREGEGRGGVRRRAREWEMQWNKYSSEEGDVACQILGSVHIPSNSFNSPVMLLWSFILVDFLVCAYQSPHQSHSVIQPWTCLVLYPTGLLGSSRRTFVSLRVYGSNSWDCIASVIQVCSTLRRKMNGKKCKKTRGKETSLILNNWYKTIILYNICHVLISTSKHCFTFFLELSWHQYSQSTGDTHWTC